MTKKRAADPATGALSAWQRDPAPPRHVGRHCAGERLGLAHLDRLLDRHHAGPALLLRLRRRAHPRRCVVIVPTLPDKVHALDDLWQLTCKLHMCAFRLPVMRRRPGGTGHDDGRTQDLLPHRTKASGMSQSSYGLPFAVVAWRQGWWWGAWGLAGSVDVIRSFSDALTLCLLRLHLGVHCTHSSLVGRSSKRAKVRLLSGGPFSYALQSWCPAVLAPSKYTNPPT